jgi:hypothetical protein
LKRANQISDGDGKPSRRSARVANIKGAPKDATPGLVIPQPLTKALEARRTVQTKKNIPPKPQIAPIPKVPEPRRLIQADTRVSQKRSEIYLSSKTPEAPSPIPTDKKAPRKKPQTVPWEEREFIKSVVASSDNPSSDNARNPTSADNQDDIEEDDVLRFDFDLPVEPSAYNADFSVQEDYFEPIKVCSNILPLYLTDLSQQAGSTSLDLPIPDSDIVMIDLTKDSPEPAPNQITKAQDIQSLKCQPIVPERTRPTKLPAPPLLTPPAPAPKPELPRVAFAASHSYHGNAPSTRSKDGIPLPTKRKTTPPMVFSPPFDYSKNTGRRHVHNPALTDKADEYDDHPYRIRKPKADPTPRIVDVS